MYFFKLVHDTFVDMFTMEVLSSSCIALVLFFAIISWIESNLVTSSELEDMLSYINELIKINIVINHGWIIWMKWIFVLLRNHTHWIFWRLDNEENYAGLKVVDEEGSLQTSSIDNFQPKWLKYLNIGSKKLNKILENRVKLKR